MKIGGSSPLWRSGKPPWRSYVGLSDLMNRCSFCSDARDVGVLYRWCRRNGTKYERSGEVLTLAARICHVYSTIGDAEATPPHIDFFSWSPHAHFGDLDAARLSGRFDAAVELRGRTSTSQHLPTERASLISP